MEKFCSLSENVSVVNIWMCENKLKHGVKINLLCI